MRFAVLDLGSTSFQLLVVDVSREGSLVPALRERVMLHLGMSVAGSGRIPQRVATSAEDTVRRLRDVARRAGAKRMLAIATSALRDAENGDEVGDRLADAAGTSIRFLDGAEEASLMLAGIRGSVVVPTERTLALDLGGGSLEVCLADRNGILWTRSLPLGAGRVTTELVRHDPPTRAERRAVRDAVLRAFAEAEPPSIEGAHAVASGGTAGALGRLLAFRRWGSVPPSLNQFEMPVDELVPICRQLGSCTLEERLQIPGMDERRAHLLPAGGIVLTAAARTLGIASVTLSEWGLREGVVLEALGRARRSAPSPVRLREGSIRQLRDRWIADRAHAATIERLALALFDKTSALHGLGPVERELLGYAATLHDLGTKISTDRSHRHGAYLIEHAPLKGFDPEEVFLLASVVRFQKGSPGAAFEPYARLDAAARERCKLLIGLLRVAHALGHASPRDAESLDVEAKRGRVRITVGGSGNPRGAVADARAKADLLARALGADVDILVAPTEAASA